MNVRNVSAMIVVIASAGVSHVHGQQTIVPSDSARLQGIWTMVSGSADGYPMPPGSLSTMKRVAAGNIVTITMNGTNYFTATFALNPAARPRTIDYHMTGGFTAGATQFGIYEFRGDTLWFAFGSPGDPRPNDFSSKSGDGRTVSAWLPARP